MKVIKNHAADLHEWGKRDRKWCQEHPEADWYYRDPGEGEWDGFRFITMKHYLALRLEEIVDQTPGRVEFKICVFRVEDMVTTRFPAAYSVDDDEYLLLTAAVRPDGVTEVFRVTEEDQAAAIKATYRASKENGGESLQSSDACHLCGKIFDHADIIFSAAGIEPEVLCEKCGENPPAGFLITGVGLYFSKPPKESRLYRDKMGRATKKVKRLVKRKPYKKDLL